MHFKTLADVDVRGKRVIVREDLNVPMKAGRIADDTRLTAALETLRYLRDHGAKTIVMSHLGRPDGKVVPAMSLRPVAEELHRRLGTTVAFASDCIGKSAEEAVAAMENGDVVLLENLRFHAEEEENDPLFARQLASLAEIYVNDAFGTAHRAHASTAGIARDLPAFAGFLMQKELEALGRLTSDPRHPFVCAIGGAKVKDKVGVFVALLERVDGFVVGGGMANTFLAARGIDVGTSLRDADLEPARRRERRAHPSADRRRRFDRLRCGRERNGRADRRRGRTNDPRHRAGDRASLRARVARRADHRVQRADGRV
jgi:phosphoglycerate kinase